MQNFDQNIENKAAKPDQPSWGFFLLIFILILAVGVILCVKYFFPEFFPGARDSSSGSSQSSLTRDLDEQLAAQGELKKFTDYDELRDFLAEHPASSLYSGSYALGFGGGVGSSLLSASDVAIPEFSGDSVGPALGAPTDSAKQGLAPVDKVDYSRTNVQVEGIDEADIVKTDGEYVYAVSEKNLFIVDAYPAAGAKILATIKLDSSPREMYINGDSLVIFGDENNMPESLYDTLIRQSSYTFFKVFDISDHTNPRQVRDLDFEGNYLDSRMIGDYVYFLTSASDILYTDDVPVPFILEDEKPLPFDAGAPGCNCPDVYYFDAPYDSYTFTSLAAINVVDHGAEMKTESYVFSGSQEIYVSPENLYLTYTKNLNEQLIYLEVARDEVLPRMSAEQRQRITDIENVDPKILSDWEKLMKIGEVLAAYHSSLSVKDQEKLDVDVEDAVQAKYKDLAKELEKTVIHKIHLDGAKMTQAGSGEVTGYVLNQFSMDEHNGYFRIATTKNQMWSRFDNIDAEDAASYSNVYVLDEDMKQVGAVEELARGEKIYSARFMQGRVYLVTFQQVDPLFAIDLSDPRKPRVLGELKVPGFSTYLHPYDETTLIGFGQQTKTGPSGGVVTTGLKVSLFDVSDVKNLREIDTFEMGGQGSTSYALDDHRAFLFSREKNLLVLPVELQGNVSGTSSASDIVYVPEFRGAMVFSVDKDKGIDLKGRIDHTDGKVSTSPKYFYDYNFYEDTVQRSLYIEDTLYTLSTKFLAAHKLADLTQVNKLSLPKEAGDDYVIVK